MSEYDRGRSRPVNLANTLVYFGEASLPSSTTTRILQVNLSRDLSTNKPFIVSAFVQTAGGSVDVTSACSSLLFRWTGSSYIPTTQSDKDKMEQILSDTIKAYYHSESFLVPRLGSPVVCVQLTGEDTMQDVSRGRRPSIGDDIKINPMEQSFINFTSSVEGAGTVNLPKVTTYGFGSNGYVNRYVVRCNEHIDAQKIGGGAGCPLDFYYDIQNLLRDVPSHFEFPTLRDAYNKLHGVAMEVLVTTVEAGKTGAFVISKMLQIARLFVSARKRLFSISHINDTKKNNVKKTSSFIKASKEAADVWLQFRYAVMPLVLDVQSAIKVSATGFNLQKIVRGSSQNSTTYSESYGAGGSFGLVPAVMNLTADCQYTERATAYGKIQVVRDVNTVALQRALGTQQLFTTLWEVIPWSFIIDWFFNVGAFLKDLTPLTGYTFKGYSKTRIVTKQVKGSVTVGAGLTAKTVQIACSVRQYRRAPIWSQSKPTLTVNNGLNPTRLADAMALLTKTLRR